MAVFKTENVPKSRISDSSKFDPPRDEEFSRRYQLVYDGNFPLYRAEIPISLIRPFSPEFRPGEDADGAVIIARMALMITEARAQGEATPSIWVYPGSGCYVMSDDYIMCEAYISAGIDPIPCLVMGEPTVPGLVKVKGPAPKDAVDRITGRR